MSRTNTHKQIKKIILIANLIAVSVIFSYFDKIISQAILPFLPTAKIGLANIVILIGVYNFDFKDTLVMTVLKATLNGLLFGSPISFVISFIASISAFFGMYIAYKILKDKVSSVSISVIGGFIHIVMQLVVVNFIYKIGDAILYYGAIMILISLITSIIIGYVTLKLIPYFEK